MVIKSVITSRKAIHAWVNVCRIYNIHMYRYIYASMYICICLRVFRVSSRGPPKSNGNTHSWGSEAFPNKRVWVLATVRGKEGHPLRLTVSMNKIPSKHFTVRALARGGVTEKGSLSQRIELCSVIISRFLILWSRCRSPFPP